MGIFSSKPETKKLPSFQDYPSFTSPPPLTTSSSYTYDDYPRVRTTIATVNRVPQIPPRTTVSVKPPAQITPLIICTSVIESKIGFNRRKKQIPLDDICILCDTNDTQMEHIMEHYKSPISSNSAWNKTKGCNNFQLQSGYDSTWKKFLMSIDLLANLKISKIILLSYYGVMEPIKYNNSEFSIYMSMLTNRKRNRLLVFYQYTNTEYEYFESFDFYVCGDESTETLILKEKPFQFERRLSFINLNIYPTSPLIALLFNRKFRSDPTETNEELQMRTALINFKAEMLNPTNYNKMFSLFLEIEDFEESKDKCEFSSSISYRKEDIFLIKVPAKLFSLIEEGKFVTIESPLKNKLGKHIEHNGNIHSIDIEKLSIEVKICNPNRLIGEYNDDPKKCYTIYIYYSRMMTQLQHFALEQIEKFRTKQFLFPVEPEIITHKKIQLNLCNKNIESNAEQKQAIEHIVMGSSYPAPYIIFGPPGTGKTSVIVESICQLLLMKPKSKILICVGSNSVGDDIANSLLKYILEINRKPKLLRLYAPSANRTVINENVLDFSNYDEKYYPSLACICGFDVIVSTLGVCGRLMQSNISSDHFTHVFIDEAGCVLETTALLPIAVCSSLGKINAEIILSGDPNQLGPITKCKINPLPLNGSFLERLMNLKMYKKNQFTNKYNPNVLTKLIKNYRSHKTIIKIPNQILYEGEMIAAGSKEKTQWALNLEFLPAAGFPIVFKDFCGEAEKEADGTSWYNEEQIEMVVQYIKLLLSIKIKRKITQSDIGICTPYKAQCKKLREICTENSWNEIEIGVSEQFQGQEKPIMIISMVRTRTQQNSSLGFLNDVKRWNVIVTRAEALLIVIGDSSLLQTCSYWRKFINYVKSNNGFIQAVAGNINNKQMKNNNKNRKKENDQNYENNNKGRNNRRRGRRTIN